jgi:hypothetical protein
VPVDAVRQDRKLVQALVGGGTAKTAAVVVLALVLMEAVLLSCCALIKPWRDGGREERKRDDGWYLHLQQMQDHYIMLCSQPNINVANTGYHKPPNQIRIKSTAGAKFELTRLKNLAWLDLV